MTVLVGEQVLPENPLVDGLEHVPGPSDHPGRVSERTGDLSMRKLLPAVYNLAHDGALAERFELVGVSRGEQTDADFRAMARESIERFSRRRPDPNVLEGLLAENALRSRRVRRRRRLPAGRPRLDEIDAETGLPLNRMFYLSTAPQFFPLICGKLGDVGLNRAEKAQTGS